MRSAGSGSTLAGRSSVRDLVKRYAEVTAVDGLSFDIGAGEVYGLLGENGAGKSTTIEILEGHRHATSGEVSVLGVDPRRADGAFHDRIGIVLQSSGNRARADRRARC